MAQTIDVFENPFMGMEGKIKKNLGEADEDQGNIMAAANADMEGEQQMFETFVKEKHTLLGYVHDLIRFAAKLQDIDIDSAKILSNDAQAAGQPEESKEPAELRIKSEKDCANIANRIIGVVSVQ